MPPKSDKSKGKKPKGSKSGSKNDDEKQVKPDGTKEKPLIITVLKKCTPPVKLLKGEDCEFYYINAAGSKFKTVGMSNEGVMHTTKNGVPFSTWRVGTYSFGTIDSQFAAYLESKGWIKCPRK